MRWRFAGILVFALVASRAESQPPTPSPGVGSKAIQRPRTQEQREAKSDQPSAPPTTLPQDVQVAPQNPKAVTQTGTDEIQHTTAANEHHWWPPSAWDSNWAMFIITVALLFVGIAEWFNNFLSIRHSRTTERAYVTLSHESPGIDIDHMMVSGTGQSYQTQDVKIRLVVKNWGSTPAKVTEAFVMYCVGHTLPERKQYGTNTVPEGGFLVPQTSFFFDRTFTLMTRDIDEIRSGKKRLWMLGYVDYIDAFRRRFRSWYARKYNPRTDTRSDYGMGSAFNEKKWAKRNNLDIETKPTYNDGPRKKGDGNDWDHS